MKNWAIENWQLLAGIAMIEAPFVLAYLCTSSSEGIEDLLILWATFHCVALATGGVAMIAIWGMER